jgi:hypothetical protein
LAAAFSVTRPVSNLVIYVAVENVETRSAFLVCENFAYFAVHFLAVQITQRGKYQTWHFDLSGRFCRHLIHRGVVWLMILARVDSVALRKLIDPDVAFFIYFGRGCRG